MNPLDFPLIADENIHPDVVARLRAQGRDITSCREWSSWAFPIPRCSARPMQSAASSSPTTPFTIETLSVLAATHIDVTVPFILVAERRGGLVRVRVRQAVEDEPA